MRIKYKGFSGPNNVKIKTFKGLNRYFVVVIHVSLAKLHLPVRAFFTIMIFDELHKSQDIMFDLSIDKETGFLMYNNGRHNMMFRTKVLQAIMRLSMETLQKYYYEEIDEDYVHNKNLNTISFDNAEFINQDNIRTKERRESEKDVLPPHLRGKHLYLIRNETNGLLKIGMSKNPKKRLGTLNCSTTDTLTLLSVKELQGYTEPVVHDKFKIYRVRGEWFRPHKEIYEYFNLNIEDYEVLRNN